MDYKRFISYLYSYIGGEKGVNVGYIRCEQRQGICRFTLSVQDVHGIEGGKYKVYLYKVLEDKTPVGYILDEIVLNRFCGELKKQTSSQNAWNTGKRIDEFDGVIVRYDAGHLYASQWSDTPIMVDRFVTWQDYTKRETKRREKIGQVEFASEQSMSVNPEQILFAGQAGSEAAEKSWENYEHKAEWSSEGQVGETGKDNSRGQAGSRTEGNSGRKVGCEEEGGFARQIRYGKEGNDSEQTGNEKEGNDSEQTGNEEEGNDSGQSGNREEGNYSGQSRNGEERNSSEKPGVGNEDDSELKELRREGQGKADAFMNRGSKYHWVSQEEVYGSGSASNGKEETPDTEQGSDAWEYAQEQASNGQSNRIFSKESSQEFKSEDVLRAAELNSEKRKKKQQPMKPAISPLTIRVMENRPKLPDFENHEIYDCVRIEPNDIGLLEMENWKLGVNSFLTHGYYNYKYLMLGKLRFQDGVVKAVLGVPGVYDGKEQYIAKIFGFEVFVPVKHTKVKTGNFGYWIVELV